MEGGDRETRRGRVGSIEGQRVSRERGRGTEKEGGKELCNNIQNRYCMHAPIRAATTVWPLVRKPCVLRRVSLVQREGDLSLPCGHRQEGKCGMREEEEGEEGEEEIDIS